MGKHNVVCEWTVTASYFSLTQLDGSRLHLQLRVTVNVPQ